MSPAIASISAGDDMSWWACIDGSEGAAAMTGWETGAIARPKIIKTASSFRMAEAIFTALISHKLAGKESYRFLNTSESQH